MSGSDEVDLVADTLLREALLASDLDLDFFTAALHRSLESSPAEADADLIPGSPAGNGTTSGEQEGGDLTGQRLDGPDQMAGLDDGRDELQLGPFPGGAGYPGQDDDDPQAADDPAGQPQTGDDW